MEQKENKIISEAMQEYSGFVSSGRQGKFSLSEGVSQDLSKLSRELEQKRQLGALTETEKMWMRQIDEFTERSLRNVASKSDDGAAGQGEPIYDLGQQLKLEQRDEDVPAPVSRISKDVAEQVIGMIDKQFEDKIMNPVRKEREAFGEPKPQAAQAETTSKPDDQVQGQNLQDFMTALRAERPEVPFSDRDSKVDLSQLVNKQSHGKSGT